MKLNMEATGLVMDQTHVPPVQPNLRDNLPFAF